jgi:molybdopterin converting factor small subunit
MAIVFDIPGPLRALAGNRERVSVQGSATTVAEALALFWAECPGVRDRIVTELGEVRPHVNIYVDGESIRYSGGLKTPVRDSVEILIVPAVSGG